MRQVWESWNEAQSLQNCVVVERIEKCFKSQAEPCRVSMDLVNVSTDANPEPKIFLESRYRLRTLVLA